MFSTSVFAETDAFGHLSETPSAHQKLVFSDQSPGVTAISANSLSLSLKSFIA
jgi:hypothetical protein